MESKFIIEVFHKGRWSTMPMYIAKIGNQVQSITFGGFYQARLFDTKKEAEKAATRVGKYIDEAAKRGYSTYCYNYDPTDWHPVYGNFRGRMMSSDMEIKVREVKLEFV